jgi:hypothetical protein
VSRALFIGHYGVSLAAKRIYARLSSAWIFLAVRQFPGIFRGDVRGSFLVGSKADGIVHTSTLTGFSEVTTIEKATLRRGPTLYAHLARVSRTTQPEMRV